VQMGQFADLAGEEGAALTLVGGWAAVVPHVVRREQLGTAVEGVDQGNFSVASRRAESTGRPRSWEAVAVRRRSHRPPGCVSRARRVSLAAGHSERETTGGLFVAVPVLTRQPAETHRRGPRRAAQASAASPRSARRHRHAGQLHTTSRTEQLGQAGNVLILADTRFREEGHHLCRGAAPVLRHGRAEREVARPVSSPPAPLPAATPCSTASAAAGNVCPSRSGVRCVLSACRPEVLVLDVLGLSSGAARVRAGRRDGANVACCGTSSTCPSPGQATGNACRRGREPWANGSTTGPPLRGLVPAHHAGHARPRVPRRELVPMAAASPPGACPTLSLHAARALVGGTVGPRPSHPCQTLATLPTARPLTSRNTEVRLEY
jgi:hypothetical protein